MGGMGRLRLVRERLALTQQQLGERSGVNRVTIARLEAGRASPRPPTVRKLADALGVTPGELLNSAPAGNSTPRGEKWRLSPRQIQDLAALAQITLPDEDVAVLAATVSAAHRGLAAIPDGPVRLVEPPLRALPAARVTER